MMSLKRSLILDSQGGDIFHFTFIYYINLIWVTRFRCFFWVFRANTWQPFNSQRGGSVLGSGRICLTLWEMDCLVLCWAASWLREALCEVVSGDKAGSCGVSQRSEPQHSWPCSCSEDCFPSAPRARPCYLQWTPASVSLQHLNFKIVKWQFLPPALPPRVPCLTMHPLIRTLRPLSLPLSFVPCIQSAQFHQIHGSLPYPKPTILFWVLTILVLCSILICQHQSVLMFFFS